ncbi:hypothetical protein ID866_8862, partial [Astraeus odoratus]
MTLVATSIDDRSPLISYDAGWSQSIDDELADRYLLGTHTTSNMTNAQAKFSFNGTALSIYGARDSNYGTFTVQVDDAVYANNNGYSSTFLYRMLNFNITGLTQQMHSVTVINTGTGGAIVSIDWVLWQSDVGDEGAQLVTEMVQDTDPRFQYEGSTWTPNCGGTDFFNNGSGYLSSSGTIVSSSLSAGAIAGIAVAVALVILTSAMAFYYRRRYKVAETAYHHLYNVYKSQQPPNSSGAISTSLDTRLDVILMQNVPSTQLPVPEHVHRTSSFGATPHDDQPNRQLVLPS